MQSICNRLVGGTKFAFFLKKAIPIEFMLTNTFQFLKTNLKFTDSMHCRTATDVFTKRTTPIELIQASSTTNTHKT